MVRELLTSRGSSYDDPAANFFRTTREPKPTMEKTTQVFLGVRMVCAQCHDHPFERWTQNQYYQMAAFFSAVGLRPGYEVGEEIVYDQRADYEMKHPKDSRVVAAAIPDRLHDAGRRSRATSTAAMRWPIGWSPRTIRSSRKRSRIGSGAISSDTESSILSMISAPPIRPSIRRCSMLLRRTSSDHNFDLQHLMRTIVNSRAYQASFVTNEWNADGRRQLLARDAPTADRRALMDAVASAAGARPAFPEVPEDTNASQVAGPACRQGWLSRSFRPARRANPPASASAGPI